MRVRSLLSAAILSLGGLYAAGAASALPAATVLAPDVPVEQAQFGAFGYGWTPGYYYGPRRYYGYGPGPYYGPGYYGPPRSRVVCRVRPGPYGPREVCWRR